MNTDEPFFNLYNHGFVRVAVGIPTVRVAEPEYNARETIALMKQAAERKALLVVFPELGLSAYSCEDLFQQQALLDCCKEQLASVLRASEGIPVIAIVGLPLVVDGLLFNCAAVLSGGHLLGVIPKTYLPNYREFYEMRQFVPADCAQSQTIQLLHQQDVPFGNQLLFQLEGQPLCTVHVEICEDLWVPIPLSSYAALAGATVLINLSASNITIGKAEYRRQLVASQSARCLAAYLYTSAGFGESTTDLAWDGHGMIYENGTAVAESSRFSYKSQLLTGDLDLDRLAQDRRRQTSFGDSVRRHRGDLSVFRTVRVPLELPCHERLLLDRAYSRLPYVPSDPEQRDERCREVYEIQVQGLVKRLRSAGISKVVIGVSGGLDSTQALIVCTKAMDVLGVPRTNVLGYTLPGFATSKRTLDQAWRLMHAIGCTAQEIDIRPSAEHMLENIGHPHTAAKSVHDVTFENVQAGARTSLLFRLANQQGALVVGTSDFSELALGWCTYGVGDHMAHYHVNASVPKTLVQHLIHWVAATSQLGGDASPVLTDILETKISPELVPGENHAGQPIQRSEDVVGPFELQDFFLYYVLRFGYSPPKVAFLAYNAWRERKQGESPGIPDSTGREYGIGEIKKWLRVFLDRFFHQSQFKRSAIPNAPKVGSGGSLSPRSDYRAPSDSEATVWLSQLDGIPGSDS
ncbi:MAG: NAD(+) synthase [Nitrospira sp. CG24C]|jgi:NAD+ synthase (glutamine-hydrolysing)|nr:MAG: NAD(+) synthase [Nitrospira sp. CG24C]